MRSRFPDQPYAWKFVLEGVNINDSIALGAIEENLDYNLFNFDNYVKNILKELKKDDIYDLEAYQGEYYAHSGGIHYKVDESGYIAVIWVKYYEIFIPSVKSLPQDILNFSKLKYLQLPCSIKCIENRSDCFEAIAGYKVRTIGPQFPGVIRSKNEDQIYYFEMIDEKVFQLLNLEAKKWDKNPDAKYNDSVAMMVLDHFNLWFDEKGWSMF